MTNLSIITPTLNCVETLAATLESVRPLVAQGAEHLVVDSGSTDGTLELCRRVGVRVLTHPPGNLYAAVNAGIRAAAGEWITYINGDDQLRAAAIAAALDVAGRTEADILYGNIEVIDEAGRLLHAWRSPPVGWVRRFHPQTDLILQQGTLIRRACWERLGGFDETFRYAADYDFFLRAVLRGERFHRHGGAPLAAFRAHKAQLSRRPEVQRAMGEECGRARVRASVRPAEAGRWLAVLCMKLRNLDTILMRLPRAFSRGRLWVSYARPGGSS